LTQVKAMIEAGKVRSTFTALAGAAAAGVDFAGMLAVVVALKPKDFHKSMTTHADHRIWQDVYRSTTAYGEVYLGVPIVSFKEL